MKPGLPTPHTLVRAVDWLEERGKRAPFNVVATGGLRSPDRFLKALAIGADAVYIGSAAISAVIRAQMADLQMLPAQLALYRVSEGSMVGACRPIP